MIDYKEFLRNKVTVAQNLGFEIDYNEINPLLKPHQKDIVKWFRDHNLQNAYSYESHVKIGETIDGYGRLPVTFMLLQPPSWSDDVWTDVARMRTLNMLQQKKGKEQHLCPMQFDIADRIIDRFTNPGDLVLDPFSGIGSVGYRSLLKKRKYYGVELSSRYFSDSCYYLESVEKDNQAPTMFDLTDGNQPKEAA